MNKKIVVLIVIVECILAVLLIGVIGLAIESTYKEVGCREIYFTTPEGEKLDSDAILEVARPDKGYQLHYAMDPANTSDKSVTFTSGKPEFVTVNESGYVTFIEDIDVVITISSKNGKTATVTLVPKREDHGTIIVK